MHRVDGVDHKLQKAMSEFVPPRGRSPRLQLTRSGACTRPCAHRCLARRRRIAVLQLLIEIFKWLMFFDGLFMTLMTLKSVYVARKMFCMFWSSGFNGFQCSV